MVRIAGEPGEEPLEVLVQQGVLADVVARKRRAGRVRELAVDEQVATWMNVGRSASSSIG